MNAQKSDYWLELRLYNFHSYYVDTYIALRNVEYC